VLAIELSDEPGWGKTRTQFIINEVDNELLRLGLDKPADGYGVVEHAGGILLTEGWTLGDWVGLEGYVDAPGSANSKVNRRVLTRDMKSLLKRIDGKPWVWVMQGYDRNGNWKNEDTLAALQADSFSLMRSKPFRKTLLPWALVFSYGRPGGTRDHPVLREAHRSYVFGTRT